ncbi:MAG: hypothetical protein KAR47_19070 [Planctomycetes bacterium]|nr:hypothetical protein [Planctomycetota bacterium]
MKKVVSLHCILLLWVGCFSVNAQKKAPTTPPDPSGHLADTTATVFLTGNLLSTLKPCGCTAEQLGGFERRAAVLQKARPDSRFVIDTGNLLIAQTDQDIIKFGIIIQAMSMLDYDLVNMAAGDLKIAKELGLLDNTPFSVISSAGEDDKVPVRHTKQLKIGKESILVTVATADTDLDQAPHIRKLFPKKTAQPQLNILLLSNCDNAIADIADIDMVDVVVCPTFSDEPRIVENKKTGPLTISVGRLGKYVGRLDIAIVAGGKPKLDYSSVAIDEKLPTDPDLAELYKDYQFMVEMENLLERIERVPPPDGAEYVGSETCAMCHEDEYEKWSSTRHSHAYQTLADAGSQHDPECIECHVVGMNYETGFVSQDSPKDLRDVGCEVCHGPRSLHVSAVSSDEPNPEPAMPLFKCGQCHTPEHSLGFQDHEKQYRAEIRHWTEQKTRTTVK